MIMLTSVYHTVFCIMHYFDMKLKTEAFSSDIPNLTIARAHNQVAFSANNNLATCSLSFTIRHDIAMFSNSSKGYLWCHVCPITGSITNLFFIVIFHTLRMFSSQFLIYTKIVAFDGIWTHFTLPLRLGALPLI